MTKQYEIGEEIFDNVIVLGRFGGEGKSGFGVVYLVVEKDTGFPLALKTLQKDNISISDFNEFKKEIIPWIDLSYHPNIVKAFSIDLDDNKRPYLLMEPVFPDEYGRQSLADFMSNNLSEEQTLMWAIQFCYAMQYVNEQGFIHGDIKPDNILISNSFVKITDFGLVKSIKDSSKKYEGTNAYLAPESWKGTKNVFSEIYAFGMVLYQMVNSGQLPIDGWSDEQWENFHKNGEIQELNSDLFPFIKKCLEKNPNDRYSSFGELNHELIKLLDEKYNKSLDKPKLEDIGNVENINRGHLAATLNDAENCKKYYDIAIANSDNNSFIYNYALDLISLEEYQDALIQLRKLVENPGFISLDRIYFNIGKCYHEGICLYKSIEYYKKAINVNNNDFKAHVNLGNVYKDYGFFEEAKIEYEYVLNLDPKFPQALLNIVDLFDKMNNEEGFKKYSEKLGYIQQNPQINYYSGIFLKDNNLLKFLTSMDTASEEYSYQIPALIQLFEFHLSNGNIEEANLKFEDIIKLTDDVDLLTELCFKYKTYGKYKESLRKIDYIYNNLEKNKEYVLLKKSHLIQDHDLNTAIKICNTLLNEKYSDEFKSKVYITVGNLFLKINPEMSLDYFLKSYELDSKNIFSLLNISSIYANNRDYEIAEHYIDKGLKINKFQYDLLFNKSRLCQDQFKYEEAIIYYNKCLKIYPTNEVYGFASFCFLELGKIEQAGIYSKLAMNISEKNESSKYLILYLPFLTGLDIE